MGDSIEISPEHLIQRIQKDQQWITLDTWTKPDHKFTDGKFSSWCRATTKSASQFQVHTGAVGREERGQATFVTAASPVPFSSLPSFENGQRVMA